MSQIEQKFRVFLSKHPEIEKCYSQGIINRRALSRHLIKNGIAEKDQIEAVIAMLRRFNFSEYEEQDTEIFKEKKTSIKDNLTIFSLEKTEEILNELDTITGKTDFTQSETLKIIVGTANVTVIIDNEKKELHESLERFEIRRKLENISEISIRFPEKAIRTKGIISTITKELALHDIVISEFLTASNEILIYLEDEYVVEAYQTIKNYF